jgi:hypothetical protein
MGTTSKKTVKSSTTAPARRTRRTSQELTATASVSADQVAQLAYQYFEESGFAHGNDLDHWLRAETELGARK